MRQSLKLMGAAALAVLTACGGDPVGISTTPPPPEQECLREAEPVDYEIFFVVDVSGSMEPFLQSVRDELEAFAEGFPDENIEGRRVRVDYYLIGFVNDVEVFGNGRMTSIIALQDAFEDAITAGSSGYNLTTQSFNSEEEENLLDALEKVIELNPSAEARLLMVATDAPFVEAPAVLNENIEVQSTYAQIREQLETLEVRVHGFSESLVPGMFVDFHGQPPLTDLPGSSRHRLEDLAGSSASIRNTLFNIAQDSACN